MDELVLLSKAMGDENRLKIVALIAREKELCVCEICDTLELSQPLISRHLKQLKTATILEDHKEGKWRVYTIVTTPTPLLKAYLISLEPIAQTLKPLCTCATR